MRTFVLIMEIIELLAAMAADEWVSSHEEYGWNRP